MNGNTALHVAADYNQGEAMKLILRTDTSLVFQKNNRDKTALDISTDNKFHLCIELVSLALVIFRSMYAHSHAWQRASVSMAMS